MTFAIARGIADWVGKKLDAKGRVGRAVQSALNSGSAAAGYGRCQHREVLQVVGAGVGVAGIVGRHAVANVVDSQAKTGTYLAAESVGEDRVAQNGDMMRGGIRAHAGPIARQDAIERNCVACSGGRSADGAGDIIYQGDAALAVAQGTAAQGVGPDQIRLHDVIERK